MSVASLFDFDRAVDATVAYQHLRAQALARGTHGLLYPAEIVDVSGVLPRRPGARWHEQCQSVFVLYAADSLLREWWATLGVVPEGGRNPTGLTGLAPLADLTWKDGFRVDREFGITVDELRALLRGCVPERIRSTVRETDVDL